MSIQRRMISALKRGRRQMEKLMTDTVEISRQTGKRITDPFTGKVTQEVITVYQGKASFAGRLTEADEREVAEAHISVSDYHLQLPVKANVSTGDIATVTDSLTDPLLVNKTYRLRYLHRHTRGTKIIAGVEES